MLIDPLPHHYPLKMSLLQYFPIPTEELSIIKQEYKAPNLSVDYYPKILTTLEIDHWYRKLEDRFSDSSRSTMFGNEGLIYTTVYRGETNHYQVEPWTSIPGLIDLKQKVEELTGETFTVVAIKCYVNGKKGIAPHRDKEMIEGTKIAGLSFGSKRTLTFTKPFDLYAHQPHHTRQTYDTISIPLASGSLYVMNPPTNQKWLHSIEKDSTVKLPRFVLTFRNYVEA